MRDGSGQPTHCPPQPTRTLAKRCLFGKHLSPSIPPQEHHPWVTLTLLWTTTQNTDGRDSHHQPSGVHNTTFNKQTSPPCWCQGRTWTTKKAPSLVKDKEIFTGAFHGILGIYPPTHPSRGPQHATSHSPSYSKHFDIHRYAKLLSSTSSFYAFKCLR